ncbi:MAG: hypothetical protein NTZ34_05835 [Chloroflexi bacterium]|nr:hypothetical protein [Chloroflexota bacterium]
MANQPDWTWKDGPYVQYLAKLKRETGTFDIYSPKEINSHLKQKPK